MMPSFMSTLNSDIVLDDQVGIVNNEPAPDGLGPQSSKSTCISLPSFPALSAPHSSSLHLFITGQLVNLLDYNN